MLDKVKAKDFKSIIGTKVTLTVMDGPDIELRVEEVLLHTLKDSDQRPKGCRQKPFTVVLSGPAHHQAEDGVYDLTFEEVGVVENLFVDNKSGTPECEDYNAEQVKRATEAFEENYEEDEEDEEEAVVEYQDESFEQEDRILYDVIFG